MKRARQRSKPTFLWQGVLISVPMLLLAAIGVYALHKDRLLAMENARQRARETLAPLALTMGHRFETELTRWNTLAPGSLGPLETGNVSSPSNAPGLEWWTRALTNAPKGPLPAVLIFSEGGALHWPKPYARPPEPAPWHAELTQTQRLLWDHICSMENTSDVIPLLERFLALQPSSQARLNADWVRLRSEIPTRTMDQAGTQLLEFADRTRQAQTESGLPLSTLVLLDLVRQCSRSGLNERAWIRLSEEVIDRPSMLMPFLLDAVDAASGGRELSDEARALRAVWEFQEAQRKVANLVRESGVLRAALATNFWMGTPRNWMLSRPIQTVSRTTQDGRMLAFTNTVIQVFVYPKDLVEKALEPALAQAGHLPSYSTLAVELAGERLGSNTQTGIFTNEVLAGTGVTLSGLGAAQADPATGAAFRAAPEGPEMRMFVLLTDSSRLLAGQQQRQFLLGGFIAAALLVAGIGLLGARRAFLKQERLNELKDNFVSSVSHELRAPIASVRLMAESLEKRKISDPGKQSDYYRLMSQECRRLSSLIANVLDFSRIEQGRKEYQFEPTDLEAMVRDTINLMRPYAEERQVGLEVVWKRDPRQPAEALVDGKAIQQALINLVDNAIKHAPSKTVVTIGLELVAEPRASALLWVADKGPGIALGEHQKIFERFYRLGSELRRETQGVGIGLSLVKHIVEAHAGRVSVESEPGQGSRFTLHLPLRGGLEIGLGEET